MADLSSLRWATVPQVDFSSLGNLGKTYRDARISGNVDRALANSGDMSLADLSSALLRAGDSRGGMAAAQLARQQGNDDFDRFYKTQVLARSNQEPAAVQTVRAAGIDPASPEGRKALFPRTDTPISATDKKAIFEAEDSMPQLQGTVEALNRALELNDKTFTGALAGWRADIGSKLPDLIVPDRLADPATAVNTNEWQKIMGPEALQVMAGTLKGATTDFELRKFIEMLGDPATPAPTRKSIIQRMKTLAERKIQINQTRLKELRGGGYFRPGGGQAENNAGDPLGQARQAIEHGADPNAVRQRLIDNGIDPSGL